MRLTRIYHPESVSTGSVTLSARASHHLANVLRAQVADKLILFDGHGHRFAAHISAIEKKVVRAVIDEALISNTRSPLVLHLGQGLSRGEKMDWTIQKATELGVSRITPLLSEHCNVKVDAARLQKKHEHWESIIISACEQCGQDTLPELAPITELQQWITTVPEVSRFILAPTANSQFNLNSVTQSSVALLVGPEGGLSSREINSAMSQGFSGIALGPRILRTETAAMTAIGILQFIGGDLQYSDGDPPQRLEKTC